MTYRHRRSRFSSIALSLLYCLVAVSVARSAGTDGSTVTNPSESAATARADLPRELYDDAVAAAEAQEYQKAIRLLDRARRLDLQNAEIVNMLAFCQRKSGQLDMAFANYKLALRLRPRFAQAREYLGEAHIDAALLQVAELRGYGNEGEAELARLVAALRRAAADLDAELVGNAAPAGQPEPAARW